MKVVEVTRGLNHGGAESLLLQRLSLANERRTTLVLNTLPHLKGLHAEFVTAGIRVRSLRSNPLASIAQMIWICRAEKPDVVVVHSPWPATFLKLARRLRVLGAPLVQVVRWRPVSKTRLLGRQTHQQVGDAAISLRQVKGQRGLLRAMSAGTNDCDLVIIGEGPDLEDLRQDILDLDRSAHLRLEGYQREAWKWIVAADLVCLPSRCEGLPVVLMEAVVAGTPVLATAVGGVPEIIEENVNGWLSPANDIDAYSRRLDRIWADHPSLRNVRRTPGTAGKWGLEQSAVSFDEYLSAVANRSAVNRSGASPDQADDA